MDKQNRGILPLTLGMAAGVFVVAFLLLLLGLGYPFSAALFLAGFVAAATSVVLYIGFSGGSGDGGPIPASEAHRAGRAPSTRDAAERAHRAGQAPTAAQSRERVMERRRSAAPAPFARDDDALRAGVAPAAGTSVPSGSHGAGGHVRSSPLRADSANDAVMPRPTHVGENLHDYMGKGDTTEADAAGHRRRDDRGHPDENRDAANVPPRPV